MDYLHLGTAISRQCDAHLFLTLQESISKDERQGKLRHGRVLLQQDNTSVYINQDAIVPFNNDISPSGEQPEHGMLAHEL